MRKSLRPLMAAAVTAGAVLMSSSSALAASPTGDFAPFKHCPYTNPAVSSCLHSVSTSGSIKLGNASVPITASTPITFQGGFTFQGDGSTTFFDAVGADTLSKTKLKVPGGLIGLVDTGGFGGALIALFNTAVAAANDVYATAELVGPAKFDYLNFLFVSGPVVTLPVRVHLENPFLGSGCFIGSASTPVTIVVTDGTTSPPAGVAPLTGDPGVITSNADGTVVTAAGAKLVGNEFSVPAASNCGTTFLDKPVITAGVNLKEGLPAAAGKSSAILQGTTRIGDARGTEASVQ
jgi:hypothetical protein